MTQKVFNLIDAINREGIENGIWSIYDLDNISSREYFGTEQDVRISGKVIVVYVKEDDMLCWLKPETADFELTMSDNEKLYIWKV